MKLSRGKQERGAVLVVALIMLAMVTFLVVAFVGFSRFERAAVEASMVRTEAEHALETGLVEAQAEVMDLYGRNLNHGMLVSQNVDGTNFFMGHLTNGAALAQFASSLTNKPRVPIFLDRKGDGYQETFPFFLDLNTATNVNGSRYHPTVTNAAGRFMGDPHWIGLLKSSGSPHSGSNRFIARYAYLTVPASKSLNIRYHHNARKRAPGNANFDLYARGQGNHPGEINLAAGLTGLQPGFFQYRTYSPYRGQASLPGGEYSAFTFASALHRFGHRIDDSLHIARPTKGFNELLMLKTAENSFDGISARQMAGMFHWMNSTSPTGNGLLIPTSAYGYYNFLELFSAVPQPAVAGKFDVGQIRDELVFGNAVVDAARSTVQFLGPHGLRNGDKIELSSLAAPYIDDPISFPLNISDAQGAVSAAALKALAENGEMTTTMPHRLLPGETIDLRPLGDTKIFPLLYNGKDEDGNIMYRPLRTAQIMSVAGNVLSINLTNITATAPAGMRGVVGWGVRDPRNGRYVRGFAKDPGPNLPPVFDNAAYQVSYRFTPWRLDPVPYFVRVMNGQTIFLHRSAELDEASRIRFNLERSQPSLYAYRAQTSTFEWRTRGERLTSGQVRFAPLPNNLPAGVSANDIFNIEYDRRTRNIYLLKPDGSRLQVVAANYFLQPVYQFGRDLLGASVETMAGLMLNESIEVKGGARATVGGLPVGGGAVEHSLGGRVLAPSDPANLATLEMGLGGRPESMGLWHQPRRGIPMGVNANNYTREVERIVQVAANIADLRAGYFGSNLPVGGGEVLSCLANDRRLLPFGNFAREHAVSANIRVGGTGHAGMVLCLRTDQADPSQFPAFEVRYQRANDGQRGRLQLWLWENGGLRAVASSGDLPFVPPGEYFWLKVECEAGRNITVSFRYGGVDEANCLSYQHEEGLMGQAAFLSHVSGGRVDFRKLAPGVMPAEVARDDQWVFTTRTGGNTLPSVWRGVFRRNEQNDIYLTGFQRWNSELLGRDENPSTSWYQRGAPTVIAVKDRHQRPGNGLAPAFNEFSLRTVYNTQDRALFVRMNAEVHLPGQLARSFYGNVRAVIESGTINLVYSDAAGVETVTPLAIEPGVAFLTPRDFSLDEGRAPYHTLLLSPVGPAAGAYKKLTAEIPLTSGQSSLTDIRIEALNLRVEGQIIQADMKRRAVDYLKTRMTLSAPVHFANSDPVLAANLHAVDQGLNEWGHFQTWAATDNYGLVGNNQNPRRVIHNNAFYALRPGRVGIPANARNPAPDRGGDWFRLPWDVRMLDISWQVNDPLVNSHGNSYGTMAYVPLGWPRRPVYDKGGRQTGWEPVPGTAQNPRTWYRRHWLPNSAVGDARYGNGVNLNQFNHASQPWNVGNGDASIQDPRGSDSYSVQPPHLHWNFPDLLRTPIKTVGWLGQVHRGTPWQSLYLKSQQAGLGAVTDFDNIDGILTAPNHNIRTGDQVRLSGKCPDSWKDLRLNPNAVRVDSQGHILPGELEGYAERLDANRIRVWPTQSLSAGGVDVLSNIGNVLNTAGLMVQNVQYWENWAGSLDTQPINDHRLLEVFRVDPGTPVRAQFSVNNDRPEAWAALLSGMSVPLAAIKQADGRANAMPRILGVNDANTAPEREARVDVHDGRWIQLAAGINQVRGTNAFTRVADVLRVPQLTSASPYLPVVWENMAPGFADELDIERLPQQMLSLMRVDDDPIYETYVFVERLRPALRVKMRQYSGPAVAADGTVLNYEVAGSAMRRVTYRLEGSKGWHQSIKNGHPGYWRDRDGTLRSLPPLRPVVIQSSTMQMN